MTVERFFRDATETADDGMGERNRDLSLERPPRLCVGATAPDDRADLISISRNSMITKARESVGKRRDDLYFQLDPRRIEGAPLN